MRKYSTVSKFFSYFQSLLTETSRQIYNLTAGRLQLRHVAVRIPTAWGVEPSCAPPHTLRTNTWTAADIRLSSGSLFAGHPWTLQPEGCGRRGRGRIEAGLDLLTASGRHVNSSVSVEERAGSLMREWVKLKFGVFEEEGFDGDTLYPHMLTEGRTNITNTGCANKLQVTFS
jgi:hypothetical protein